MDGDYGAVRAITKISNGGKPEQGLARTGLMAKHGSAYS